MIAESSDVARDLLARIRELPLREPVNILNVCGGHERSLTQLGLRALLPAVRLIPGPGCPVCVCPEEDLADAIEIAATRQATVLAFGDMLRVPVNAPKGRPRSLAEMRAQGADIRPIASPLDAAALARAEPQRQFVFFAAGFETTTAPVAAMLAAGAPENLSVLLAARRTWPVVELLLRDPASRLDALIAPGHVATVMGAAEWRFVPERFHLPAAIAGFSADALLAALYSVLRQARAGTPFLDNCYAELVSDEGNPRARELLAEVMEVADANWRGIGMIPGSGFLLRGEWRRFDARRRFDLALTPDKRRGEMPPGCGCAEVVLGRLQPDRCRLYGRACTPRNPVGPCMVSEEGACHIRWQSGARAA